jgi:hypothetical protein
MKTKINTFILICTLGLVGVLNVNAASRYSTLRIARTLNEQILRFENLNSKEFVFNEDVNTGIDYQKEAQLVTKWVADREEAKTIHMLIHKRSFGSNEEASSFAGVSQFENLNSSDFIFNSGAEIDYQKEAQLLTKWVADMEEAKVVQNLIDEGRLAENK